MEVKLRKVQAVRSVTGEERHNPPPPPRPHFQKEDSNESKSS